MLEQIFGLKARGSDVRTELLAGLTTFLTMAYIVAVNPSVLGQAGMPAAGVAVATCLAAGIGSILMGLIANHPLALAPGMGLNAYFTFTVVKGMGLPWQVALGCVFISGLIFLVLILVGARRLIFDAIPRSLFSAVAAGIGLFIAFVGLKDAGLVIADPGTTVAMGDLSKPEALVAIGGLVLIAVLQAYRVKAAILIGVLAATLAGWAVGLVHLQPGAYSPSSLGGAALKLDIPGALGLGGHFGAALAEIIFVFLFVDVFDNVGTLVGVARRAGLTDEKGGIPRLNRVLAVDAAAAMIGALAGTSTTTSYIESASGVATGGRTGLTSVTVGVLFLIAIAFAPLAQAIPSAATAPALIVVGAMMMSGLADVDWTEAETAIPAFLTLIGIPLTFSIANGLAFGIVAAAVLRLAKGRIGPADWLLYTLAALFVLRFAYLAGR
ncbi:MAG TPA: NCS2 family permease [Caulobacteraceae bacterium]|nr:NCS2 family permease [Caulobacteraceae bacterium]